jgi:hypothetical protein
VGKYLFTSLIVLKKGLKLKLKYKKLLISCITRSNRNFLVALFTIHMLRIEAQHKLFGVIKMGLLDEVGKIAGAIIAEQGVDKLDPDAGILEKAASAFAGYEAAKIAENKLENKDSEQESEPEQPSDDDA